MISDPIFEVVHRKEGNMLHRKDDLERARQISLDTGLAAALAASLADQLEKFGARCIAEGRKRKHRKPTIEELA